MGQLQEKYKHYREPQKFMEADVYPYFRAIEGKQGTEVEMGGHKVLMFGSNAYTGLTGDQRIIDAAKAALDKYGSGCAGSRFLNGTLDLHVKLEKEISEFIGKDDCLCFSTGFSVNQGVLAMVVGKEQSQRWSWGRCLITCDWEWACMLWRWGAGTPLHWSLQQPWKVSSNQSHQAQ